MSKQKPIEKISHDVNVDVILKCLWAIRDNDQFYFSSYGKEMIENCIAQKLKKESEIPNRVKSEDELNAVFKKSGLQTEKGKSDFRARNIVFLVVLLIGLVWLYQGHYLNL